MPAGVRRARRDELLPARKLPCVECVDRVIRDTLRLLRHVDHVEVGGEAVIQLRRLDTRDIRADVASLRDVPAEASVRLAPQAELDLELVEHTCRVMMAPVSVQGRLG